MKCNIDVKYIKPHCHHGNDVVVQVYELFGDAGRRFFRCPYYEVWYISHLCFISWPHISINRKASNSYIFNVDFRLWVHLLDWWCYGSSCSRIHTSPPCTEPAKGYRDQYEAWSNQPTSDWNQEKSTMAERITQLEEELCQERAKNLTRHFMPPTVTGRRNYYG